MRTLSRDTAESAGRSRAGHARIVERLAKDNPKLHASLLPSDLASRRARCRRQSPRSNRNEETPARFPKMLELEVKKSTLPSNDNVILAVRWLLVKRRCPQGVRLPSD